MRTGKIAAQAAHAAMASFLWMQEGMNGSITADLIRARDEWIEGAFTKICVYVNSEQELENIFQSAKSAGLPVRLITDSGLTEFHGVPTKTCLAIGPAWSADIDKITKDLPLL